MKITKKKNRGISLVSYLLLVFLLHFSYSVKAQTKIIENDSIIKYKTIGYHPSLSKEELPEQIIIYDKKEQKYSSIVESVVCKTNVCKIVDVNLLWNDIGTFDSYQLYGDDYLEKDKGVPFSTKDTAKLNSILKDENSDLQGVDIGEIEDYNPSDVDAVTGATIVIQDNEIVKGAAWTCYTLWHWVYSNLRDEIKEISTTIISENRLISFLTQSEKFKEFAFETLKNRQIFNDKIDEVLENNIYQYNNTECRFTFNYYKSVLENKPVIFSEKMLKMYQKGDANKKLQVLYAVQEYNGVLETSFYNSIFPKVIKENKYQEIYTFIEILGEKKINSTAIDTELVSVLKNDNFLISRSAYWYLKDKADDLPRKLRKKVKRFYRKNKSRL